jgi:hypothetical protein
MYSLRPDLSDLVAKLQKKASTYSRQTPSSCLSPTLLLLALFVVAVCRRRRPTANVSTPSPSPDPRSRRLPSPMPHGGSRKKTSRRVVPLPWRPAGELGSSTAGFGQGACLVWRLRLSQVASRGGCTGRMDLTAGTAAMRRRGQNRACIRNSRHARIPRIPPGFTPPHHRDSPLLRPDSPRPRLISPLSTTRSRFRRHKCAGERALRPRGSARGVTRARRVLGEESAERRRVARELLVGRPRRGATARGRLVVPDVKNVTL